MKKMITAAAMAGLLAALCGYLRADGSLPETPDISDIAEMMQDLREDILQETERTSGTQGRPGTEEENGTEQYAPDLAEENIQVLPLRYDSRDKGKRPVVKSQGPVGTCWALTATSALEAYFMPEKHIVFSAEHMALNNGFSIRLSEGGDYKMIMAYLSGWKGPVLESDDPYGDRRSEEGLEPAVHVQQMRILEGEDRDTFKQMVMEYGSVQTSLYMSRLLTSDKNDYYNPETCGYYYPEERSPSHDVLILGWDDTYSRDRFLIPPEEDGAWICQNTWGDSFGEDGIFYVSYCDGSIAGSGLVITLAEETDNYDRIYGTDTCGWQGKQGYDDEHAWFANVYTAQEEEMLEAVGFYNPAGSCRYEIWTVHDFRDQGSFADREYVTSGTLEGRGYFTVPFILPEDLEKNERFAVVVSIDTPGVGKPVVVELVKDLYTQNVSFEGKEGYISPDGDTWEWVEDSFGTNICLKAYTSLRDPEGD